MSDCPDVSVSLTSKGAEPKNIVRAVQVAPDGFCMLSHAFAEPCRKQAILELTSRCQNAEHCLKNVRELIHFWSSCGASNGNMQVVKWHVAGSSMSSTKSAHARATAAVPHLHAQSVQPASCHFQPHHKNAVRCCCDPCCTVSPSAESCQVADTPPAINGHVSSPEAVSNATVLCQRTLTSWQIRDLALLQAKQQTAAAELSLSLRFQAHRTSPVCTVQEGCL